MPSLPLPEASRALILPGPLPPLSHFGLTLLRHELMTALRYSFYHLGLPVPEVPPVKMIRLRIYLERRGLEEVLAGVPGGREILGCLLDPGGAGQLGSGAGRLRAALAFHRLRLRLPGHDPARLATAARVDAPGDDPQALWAAFRHEVSALAPRLGDALLAEILAARERREARAAGRELPPCLSRPAARFRAGRISLAASRSATRALAAFGLPDPVSPSWAGEPALAEQARRALEVAGDPPAPPHPLRGRFRHAWRAALDRITPLYQSLAASAHRRGFLAEARDAFFLPFDVAEDLAAPERPVWLPGGAVKNRNEYLTAHLSQEPDPIQRGDVAAGQFTYHPKPGKRAEWGWGQLLPME